VRQGWRLHDRARRSVTAMPRVCASRQTLVQTPLTRGCHPLASTALLIKQEAAGGFVAGFSSTTATGSRA
jgi:hypothetical protein